MTWFRRVLNAILRRPAQVENLKRKSDRVIEDYRRADAAMRVTRKPR